MRKRPLSWPICGLLAVLTTAIAGQEQIAPPKPKEPPTGAAKAADEAQHDADREAIRKQSAEFVQAFAKGDAKAVAAAWTEQGEYYDDAGAALRGRSEIEKEFAQFFKEHPKSQVAVEIDSIRFPSRDLAIEEGVLRQLRDGKELPSSTRYRALHVRDDGQWKTALCREWGGGQDRLQDLIWLLGRWKGAAKDQEMELSFEKDTKTPSIVGHFTRKAGGGAVASGTIKISLDPQTGHLRSWHFDDDGGHGQSLWTRDGNRWVLDAVGVEADGTDTAAVNVLARINNDAFTWRSLDRVAGDEALPDTAPIKLTRVVASK
jgi:uncharacterized protein (TIGR02246 family)